MAVSPTAFFLSAGSGELFCTGSVTANVPAQRRSYLILAPFGEEMNKSRHVLSALVRGLAAAGQDVLLPDLHGTGDSAGDFGDATLEIWRNDIDTAIGHLQRSGELHLVGMRAGALLAADAATRHRVDSLTLLHPVVDGRQQLNQLLRLRLAGGLLGSKSKETASGLRQRLADGEALEIAGYRVSPDLALALETLALEKLVTSLSYRINWIELVAEAERPLMPVSQRLLAQWQQAGIVVRVDPVVCDQFWATQEIAQCPAIVEAALARLAGA